MGPRSCGCSASTTCTATSRRPPGERVTPPTFPDGRRLDPQRDYTVVVNAFLAAGGGEFGVFAAGEDRRTVGTDIGALTRHAGGLPQPFVAPNPTKKPRVTLAR